MSTSIRCPHCSAVLNIKDPSVLGKKLRCPKCRQVFASTKVPEGETPAFASLDFEDKPRDLDHALDDMLGEKPYEFADSGAVASIWTPPVREVPVVQESKPTLSPEEIARRRSRRDKRLLIVGSSVCVMLAVVLIVAVAMTILRGVQRQGTSGDVAGATGSDTSGDGSGGSASTGNLPTVFGFDDAQRALLVDYLVSQGNGKPKAKLTMAMVVNALKKLAADFNIEPSAEFPEQLELLRERIAMRDVPAELLESDKVPKVFEKMIAEYQERKLGPAEEQVAILVLLAFLGDDL